MDELVVVIPIYKKDISNNEEKSILQCIKVLKNYPICIVTHRSLDLSSYQNLLIKKKKDYYVEYFDQEYFTSILSYNRLMLSAGFYSCFSRYRYMLIYQLDAWIFKDDILKWCHSGFDYVGAPIPFEIFSGCFFNYMNVMDLDVLPIKACNGGFSLRNVSVFNATAIQYKDKFNIILNEYMPEDIIWSFLLQSKIPNRETAIRFAFDAYPQMCFQETGGSLPMGCHAWYRTDYGVYDAFFWQRFISPVRYWYNLCCHVIIRKAHKAIKIIRRYSPLIKSNI